MNASKGAVSWPESDREDMLIFKTICKIEPTNRSEGVTGCCFRVRRRAFRDLSFQEGRVIQSYGEGCELREHEDGTGFLFFEEDIPTFDSEDREWDSVNQITLYEDAGEILLICCKHGYRIPRIEVYIGLVHATTEFAEWLKRLAYEQDRKGLQEKLPLHSLQRCHLRQLYCFLMPKHKPELHHQSHPDVAWRYFPMADHCSF